MPSKIVSEYDQEIPQSQTADKPMVSRGNATQKSGGTRQAKQSIQLSLFPINMVAKLEWTQSNAQQNIEQLQNPTIGVTINNESTTTEPPPKDGQHIKPLGGSNAFYLYQIFALDSAVVEA